MRVYRYMCEAELKAFLEGNMAKVGTSRVNNASNTHRYKQGVKYLHFFKNVEDLRSIREIKASSKDNYYIGLFDIPLPILAMGMGKGYYNGRGYDIDHITVREYAIPAEKVKADNLVFYIEDEKRDILAKEVKEAEKRAKVYVGGIKPASPYEIKREDMVLSPSPTQTQAQSPITAAVSTSKPIKFADVERVM